MKKIPQLLRRRDGAALIAVMAIMAVVVVLCLALLLASSVLLRSTRQLAARRQSRVFATSLSEVLNAQLTDPAAPLAQTVTREIITDKTWYDYNDELRGHSQAETFRHYTFSADQLAAFSGRAAQALEKADVTMYWEKEELDGVDDSGAAVLVTRYTLTVITTCGCDGVNCSITQSYDGADRSGVFTWANNDADTGD